MYNKSIGDVNSILYICLYYSLLKLIYIIIYMLKTPLFPLYSHTNHGSFPVNGYIIESSSAAKRQQYN